MIENADIRLALRSHLINAPDMVAVENIQWQGRTFEPPHGEMYLREALMHSDEVISANKEITGSGIYQIDIYAPIDGQITNDERFADKIKHHFKPTTVLNGLVRIDRSRLVNAPQDIPSRYRVMLQIDYVVFSTNS
jgi:hypothetical protein